MTQIVLLKWLAVGASYLAILITIIIRGIMQIKKSTKLSSKVDQMEKDYIEMDKRHSVDIHRIEVSIESIRVANNASSIANSNQHSKLFDKLDAVGKAVAETNGYLKAKNEKK